MEPTALKPLKWIASSKEELCSFPRETQRDIGYALHFAHAGDKHPAAKPLAGFGGAGVLEIVEDFRGNTYRAVYTVKFRNVVYVLLAFQKKSTKGISTPRHFVDLIKSRLRFAAEDYRKNFQS